jgi:DNA-directed RNA polymerase beta subunit
VRCTTDDSFFPKTHYIFIDNNDVITFKIGSFSKKKTDRSDLSISDGTTLPLTLFFRALGVETDKDIVRHILSSDNLETNEARVLMTMIRPSLLQNEGIYTQATALAYLKTLTKFNDIEQVLYILKEDFLPNAGSSFKAKAHHLGRYVNQLLRVRIGWEEPTDRDNYIFKRIDVAGILLSDLFRDLYNKYRNNVQSV